MAYKTPGVYVEEIALLPPSVAQVETAIPAFIGYTQKISHNGLDLTLKPTRIKSLKEYEEIFGSAENTVFKTTGETGLKINKTADGLYEFDKAITDPFDDLKFRLYYSLQLYYANGGGPCYIVSCGETKGATPTEQVFKDAFDALKKEDEPTMLLMTDALTLTIDQYYGLYTKGLAQAADLKDRVVLIDPYIPSTDKGYKTFDTLQADFRTKIGLNNLSYGAAYYPWLRTTIPYALDEKKQPVIKGTNVSNTEIPDNAVLRDDDVNNIAKSIYHVNSDLYNVIKKKISEFTIIAPPSPAIAGVYASVDSTRGVWKAPANVSLNLVKEPMVKIDDEDQKDMNETSSGKSVNAIRAFSGRGILVWGARTLAGNDNEWRYISVRRFFNMVEESVKKSTEPFVFEPNDANTWSKIRGMIENFLTLQWRAGALQGAKPEEAFFVRVGLGETMTALDILEGRLIVSVGMAVVRPAEFIILRFSHKMAQTS